MESNLPKNFDPPQKADAYKRVARIYDRLIEPFNSGLRSLGLKMFPPQNGMRVLDVGCGTGIHLERYQKAGCDLFGIDLSPSMLQVARQRLGETANLFLGDASRMPYSDRTFDLIIMSTVLHEMSRSIRAAVLEESKRVLKENGRILLIDFHPGPIRPLKGWFYKSMITLAEILAGSRHFKNYRDYMGNKGLSGLVPSHGLVVDKEKIVSGGNIALLLLSLKERPPFSEQR